MKDYKLYTRILKEEEQGNVRSSSAGDLSIFKYTETCVNEDRWNTTNRICRGIIFSSDGTLVARPIPKFFNINERPETEINALPWNIEHEIWEKVDGSCGILYFWNNKWQFATPGSLNSDQANYATNVLLPKYNVDKLPIGSTLITEIVYPENQIVVDYKGEQFLSLLTIIDLNGKEWHTNRIDQIAFQAGFRRPKRYNFKVSPYEKIPFEDELHEGYVIYWPSLSLRVKIKDGRYTQIHKLLNYLEPTKIVELLKGKEYSQIINQLPNSIRDKFDDIKSNLLTKYREIELDVKLKLEAISNLPSRKDQALSMVDYKYKSIVFAALDNKDLEGLIWKYVLLL